MLAILVQRRRNTKAAKCFFKKRLKGLLYVPQVIVTDDLRSYRAAKTKIIPRVQHRQSRCLNNRAENAHQPTRLRGRRMKRFTSPRQARQFLSAQGLVLQHNTAPIALTLLPSGTRRRVLAQQHDAGNCPGAVLLPYRSR